MENVKDYMNIKEGADNKAIELKEEIQFHIDEGMEKSKAVEMVLDGSCIGTGYKAQIRWDFT
jgi:hypothetical protein